MLKDIRRYGAVKQEALSALHARRSQPITLGVGFNTLGNYVQIQAVRHLNNGLYQLQSSGSPSTKVLSILRTSTGNVFMCWS